MRRNFWLGIGFIVALAVMAVYLYYGDTIREFWAIDSCLDASGSWDYEEGVCDPASSDDCLDAGGVWDETDDLCRF